MKDDYEYFTESVGEQLFLILMTAVSTMIVVGIILAIALQKGKHMSDKWTAVVERDEVNEDLGITMTDEQWKNLVYNLDKASYNAIDAIIEDFMFEQKETVL